MPIPLELRVRVSVELGQMIQHLAVQMFGNDAIADSVEVNLELLLPDLVADALAGGMLPSQSPSQGGTQQGEGGEQVYNDEQGALHDEGTGGRDQETELPGEMRKAIEEAARAQEQPDVRVPLTQGPEPTPSPKEEKEESLEDIQKRAPIYSKALDWAKGNPMKEKALVETCLNLPSTMWEWEYILRLSERTFEMQKGGDKDV